MNNSPVKPKRFSIPRAITEDLGYCCMWFFFSRFGRTGLIATRLGVDPRSVRVYKSKVTNGECTCENKENCMKKLVKIPRTY